MMCTTNIHMIAAIPTAPALAPSPSCGDITMKPSPTPPVSKVMDKAQAMTVPAKTAAHDMAACGLTTGIALAEPVAASVVYAMRPPVCLKIESEKQGDENDDGDRHAYQPKQDRTHGISLC